VGGFEGYDYVFCGKQKCRIAASQMFTTDIKEKDKRIKDLEK